MKKELPLAFALLALGGFLWINGLGQVTAEKLDPASPASTDLLAKQQQPPATNEIEQASYLEPDIAPFAANYRFPNYQPSSNEPGSILLQSANILTNAPPLHAKVRMKAELFGQSVEGNGQYIHGGQGSGMSRFDMEFSISESERLIVQLISDGNYYYRIKEFAGERTIEFIDLKELDATDLTQSSGPTEWLSKHGLVSLLENFSRAFDFQQPVEQTVGGVPMLVLNGTWKAPALQNLFSDQLIVTQSDRSIAWRRMPPQLPHTVEVMVGNDDYVPYFPYRVVFSQFDEEGVSKPIVTVEYFDVTLLDELNSEFVKVATDGSWQADLSPIYVERREKMIESAAAAEIKQSKLR